MATRPASIKELLDFCNKVRKAGGTNPLQSLIPAAPGKSKECLIAKGLNFNCIVNGPSDTTDWYMLFDSEEMRDKIADELKLNSRIGVLNEPRVV